MDYNRVKTQGNSSSNQIKTVLPAINNSHSRAETFLPSNLNGAQQIQKLYFVKPASKKPFKVNDKSRKLPPGMSARQLRLLQQQTRENRWDSRFILDRIPELYPKDRREFSGIGDSIGFDSKLREEQKLRQDSATSRIGMPDNKKNNPEDEQRYYSGLIRIQDQPNDTQYTMKETKDVSTVNYEQNLKQFLPRGLLLRRDTIYRMESHFIEKQIPAFHKKIIKTIFSELKSKEEYVLPKLNVKQFKSFFDSIDSAVITISEREEVIEQLVKKIKSIIDNPETGGNLKQEIEPLLLQLSMVTLNSIESIVRWRERLQELTGKYNIQTLSSELPVYKSAEGTNYVQKILKDTEFLHLTKLYPNGIFPDPFFVSYNLAQIYENRDLLYKVRASELFVLEETVGYC